MTPIPYWREYTRYQEVGPGVDSESTDQDREYERVFCARVLVDWTLEYFGEEREITPAVAERLDFPCWKMKWSADSSRNVTDGADLKIDADNVYVHKFLPFKVHRCRNVQEKLIMLYGRGGNAIGLGMNPYAMLCTKCMKPKKPAICHICELLTGWAEYIRRDTCLFLKAAKRDSHHIADLTHDQYQCNQGERVSAQALAQYEGRTCHIQKRWVGANDTVWGYFLLWKPNLLRVTAVIRDWTKWSSLVVIMVIDREYLTADRYIVK